MPSVIDKPRARSTMAVQDLLSDLRPDCDRVGLIVDWSPYMPQGRDFITRGLYNTHAGLHVEHKLYDHKSGAFNSLPHLCRPPVHRLPSRSRTLDAFHVEQSAARARDRFSGILSNFQNRRYDDNEPHVEALRQKMVSLFGRLFKFTAMVQAYTETDYLRRESHLTELTSWHPNVKTTPWHQSSAPPFPKSSCSGSDQNRARLALHYNSTEALALKAVWGT